MSFGWFGCSMNFRRHGRRREGHPAAPRLAWGGGVPRHRVVRRVPHHVFWCGGCAVPCIRMREKSHGLCGRFGRLCRSGAMAPFRAGAVPNVCEGAKPRRAAATCTCLLVVSAWFHRRTCCGTCTARAASACSRCSMPCSLRHGCRRRRAGAAFAGFRSGPSS